MSGIRNWKLNPFITVAPSTTVPLVEIERSLINVDDASVLSDETCEVHCVALSLLVKLVLLLSAMKVDLLWNSIGNPTTLVKSAELTSIHCYSDLLLYHLHAISQ